MFPTLRSRLTYANVVATLALFLALGGGTTAIALEGRNTVDTGDIINQQVKSADAENDGLKGVDVDEASLGVVPSAETATSASSATNADKLDDLDSTALARGENFVGDNIPQGIGGPPTVLTGRLHFAANTSSDTVDFGQFRIEGTQAANNQFRVCNEHPSQIRHFVIYTGGNATSTAATRQKIALAGNSCSAALTTSGGNDSSDFQVYGPNAVVFAQASSACCTHSFYAIVRP
jgi:hypothetical protein